MATPYTQQAKEARLKVLDMVFSGQSSHIGSNFSCIDILTVLFDRVDLKKDKVIFSKGWVAASAYYFLSKKGFIETSDLDTFCQEGSKYIGLLEPTVPGVEVAGGSMGYGLPFGVGFSMAKRLSSEEGRVFVLMSDGEMQTGTTWEAALIAAHHRLENIVVIVDNNGLQGMGETEQIVGIDPLYQKWVAFGWSVMNVDGHDFTQIENAIKITNHKPMAIIAKTIKGKGVSFMEKNNLYHYKNLTEDEYAAAKKELC